MVFWQGIHFDPCRHERDVIDHRGRESDGDGDGGMGLYGSVEPLGEVAEETDTAESADGQEDTEEEEDARHIDSSEDGENSGAGTCLFIESMADAFGDEPEDSEGDDHADEGREMGDGLEDRDTEESDETDAEEQDLVPGLEVFVVGGVKWVGG